MPYGDDLRPGEWTGPCPLCGSAGPHRLFHGDRYRPYYRCGRCSLVFVPHPWHLDRAQEKARYDTHQNDPDDRGYRTWLERIIPPLEEGLGRSVHGLSGLDYGCGPGPALARILEERGASMALYDPFYRDYPPALENRYDFITCTEVIEHMSDPAGEVHRLGALLKPRGVLALMTQLLGGEREFGTWYYKDDETHVGYFSRRTFLFLAEKEGLHVDFTGRDIIILAQ